MRLRCIAPRPGTGPAILLPRASDAKASGDKAFGAYVVALLTNQALFLGDNRLAIQYAETALRAGRAELSPALQADLHAMQAKAYARTGDRASCLAEMRHAETAVGRVDAAAEPAETSYVQPGLVAVQHSEALRRVGNLRNAQQYAEDAVRLSANIHSRGMVHRLATLALALAARREIEQSVATVIDKLTPYGDVPEVRDFLERAHVALAVTSA